MYIFLYIITSSVKSNTLINLKLMVSPNYKYGLNKFVSNFIQTYSFSIFISNSGLSLFEKNVF